MAELLSCCLDMLHTLSRADPFVQSVLTHCFVSTCSYQHNMCQVYLRMLPCPPRQRQLQLQRPLVWPFQAWPLHRLR